VTKHEYIKIATSKSLTKL